MKILSLLQLAYKFKLSKRCQDEIQKLYLFGVVMGTLMGFAMGLAFPVNDFVAAVHTGLIFLFNLANSFLNEIVWFLNLQLDIRSFVLGLFIGGFILFYQHYSAHHTAECCKRHNLECSA